MSFVLPLDRTHRGMRADDVTIQEYVASCVGLMDYETCEPTSQIAQLLCAFCRVAVTVISLGNPVPFIAHLAKRTRIPNREHILFASACRAFTFRTQLPSARIVCSVP